MGGQCFDKTANSPGRQHGGGALIAIFVIATAVDLGHGGQPVRFACCAATVAVIVFLDLKLRGAVAG
jgi:hypothetical protein